MTFEHKTALLVGVGGLGCPAATILVKAGVGRIVLVDDDEVDRTNLHRQILFSEADVGADKTECARARLLEQALNQQQVLCKRTRFLPENARSLLEGVDVVLEGADNYATKFLAADAAALTGVPIVHGAAITWHATVLAVAPGGRPCYRCLFEDVPAGAAQNCDTAGVLGPVVGLAGALMADRALQILADSAPFGRIASYEGQRDRLREIELKPRTDCPLCGQAPLISDIDEGRYTGATCSA